MFAEQKDINDVTVGIGSRDFQTGLKRQNQANYFISLGDGVSVSEFIPELEKRNGGNRPLPRARSQNRNPGTINRRSAIQ